MKTRIVWILWMALVLVISGCETLGVTGEAGAQSASTVATAVTETTAESSDEAAEEPPRNVPRLGVPRGLVSRTDAATPGFIFYNQLISDTTYLVDLDGQVVHTWVSDLGVSGGIYLLDDGTLLRTGADPDAPVFGGGGQGGWFQKLAWDGEVIWEFHFANEDYRPHHDIALKPNGNILAIAWEAKTVDESVAEGRDPEQIPVAGLWPDWIVELRPVGSDDAEIVWEWHMWDHVIQDFDAARENYGVVADHPELLDISVGDMPEPITEEEFEEQRANGPGFTNANFENRGSDIYHVNAINYNAELELIAISLPNINEIMVIDNSTTTEEAAGHSGGRWGKGGDILYRWGNPANYRRGDEDDRRLGGQHDVSWVRGDSAQDHRLLVFNNNVPGTEPMHSAVYELDLPLTRAGFELDEGAAFGPAEPVWQYKTDDPMDFFSPFISGAQRLSNGNTFVTEGASGRFFEIDRDGNILWSYMDPFSGDMRNADGTTPQPVGPFIHGTFRSTHVEADHPGLAGRDLRPLDPQPPFYQPPAESSP